MPTLRTLLNGSPWHLFPEDLRVVADHAAATPAAMPAQRPPLPPRRDYGPSQLALPIVGPTWCGEPLVPQMTIVGSVAIIPVCGVLARGLDFWDLVCGYCDYAHIEEFVGLARSMPEVSSVLFDVNSRGGSHAGCPEAAAVIAALTAEKMTVVFSDGVCASAAYFLASQARQILVTPSATVGSIGSIIALIDAAESFRMNGYALEIFASSPLKATGMFGKATTPEDRAYLTERMMQADARFKSAVRAGRPQIAAEALDARWFYGEQAVPLGIADGIAPTLEAVIAAMLSAGE